MPPIPPPNAPPIQNSNDPQRGRWGGLHERDGRDGRRLDARLDPLVMARGAGTLVFDLSVSSTDGSELHGPVKFHLHHRFPKPIQSIKSIRHRAAIWKQIRTDKGTFTVGAQAKTQSGEWVGLEYDLATLPNLPLKFIPNRQKAFARWLKVRTSAMIPGIAFKDILNQVVDAYTLPGLTREVQFQLNVPLATVVNVQAPFEDVVFELVRWADQQGRVGDLVRELAAARPKHSGMQAIARQYAALLTPSANPKEYVHYFGDTPAVDIQQGGKSEAKVPVKDAGFELQLNKALGYFDAAYFADMLGRMTRRVCRVELSGASGKMGTGFLVGPRALLTNYHVMEDVIKAPAAAGRVKFRFDYFKATPGGQPSVGVEVGLDLNQA